MDGLPVFRCESLEDAARSFQDMHRAAMAFAAERDTARAQVAALEQRLVDAGMLHLAHVTAVANLERMVAALRAGLYTAHQVIGTWFSGEYNSSPEHAAISKLLADTAAAAKGWIPPALGREMEGALVGALSCVDSQHIAALDAVLAKLRAAREGR